MGALTDNMQIWERIADRFGIPVVLLILFLIAIWFILKWGGKRIVEPMVTAHIGLIQALKTTNQVNTDTNVRLASNQEEIKAAQTRILGCVRDNGEKVVKAIEDQTSKFLEKLKPSENGVTHAKTEVKSDGKST